MRAAPEMSPTLDDAIRALDGFPGRPADVATARRFLEQLDDVRDVAPVLVNGRALVEHLEGAYLAGVRCADESGHVLVMSLPAFLALCPPPMPGPRSPWRERLARWFGPRAAPVIPTCTQNCNQGRACTCQPLRVVSPPPASRCAFPYCVCSFEKMVAGCGTVPPGEKQHG